MNVIVLDDEEKVCALICALIPWKELDLNLVATASDGITGLELIKEKNPDLVITDVRMPGLDGLELIEKVKEFNDNIQFIIISGYRQFDYAQKAIKFGVSDYLLKPLKETELILTLKEMKKKYEDKITIDKVHKKLLKNTSLSRTIELENFLEKDGQLENFKNYFTISDKYQFIYLKVDGIFYDYDDRAKTIIKEKIKSIYNLYLKGACTDWELILSKKLHGYCIFLSYDKENEELIKEKLVDSFSSTLSTLCNLFENIYLTLAIGVSVNSYKDFNISIESAKYMIIRRFDEGSQKIYNKLVDLKEDEMITSKLINLSEQMFATENENFKNKLLSLIKKDLMSLSNQYFPLSYFSFIKIYSDLLHKIDLKTDLINSLLTKTYYISSRKELINNLLELINSSYESIIEKREDLLSKPIKIAQDFIENNYFNDQISLEYISSLVNLNPAYFSSLFKKNTGICFIDFVLDVRIKNAKKLLTETSLAIKEITKKVGYKDSKHFTKVFKKKTGISPNEYRKLYG